MERNFDTVDTILDLSYQISETLKNVDRRTATLALYMTLKSFETAIFSEALENFNIERSLRQ